MSFDTILLHPLTYHFRKWNLFDWTASNDTVRGGKSEVSPHEILNLVWKLTLLEVSYRIRKFGHLCSVLWQLGHHGIGRRWVC